MSKRLDWWRIRPMVAVLCGMLLVSCGTLSEKEEDKGMSNYVRVVEIDGKYWFVKGAEKFLARGVNCVLPADASKTKDGRQYNVWEQYNHNEQDWMAAACGNLKAWNFNTVAGWSYDPLYEQSGMYHTRVLWLGPWGSPNSDNRLVDVFSDYYAEQVDAEAARTVSPHRTNSFLIGYFANNELPWYGERGWPTSPRVSLLTLYMKLPASAVGKQRVVSFLKAFYMDDYSAFRKDWTVDVASFDALLQCRTIEPAKPTHRRAVAAWAGEVADQYFALCSEAIRRYDPNHLFLGVRVAGRAYRTVLEACGRYADVISINQYSKSGELDVAYLDGVAALTGKPIMITEFSWRAMENSSGCANRVGADVTVQTQQDRSDAFRTYITQAVSLPYLVGYDWFQYADQPPGGRFDGEDSNYGLLDIHDQPYEILLRTITKLNGQATQLHDASTHKVLPSASESLVDYKRVTVSGDGEPLLEPLVIVDHTSSWTVWGDHAAGASIEVVDAGDGVLVLHVNPAGWGCGITLQPAQNLSTNSDGSVRIPGGCEMVVRMKTSRQIDVAPGLNESGCGPVESQTFSGLQGADGEAYTQVARSIRPQEEEFVFPLDHLEPSTGFGNQRGNRRVDLQAVESLQLFFPAATVAFDVELEEISIR